VFSALPLTMLSTDKMVRKTSKMVTVPLPSSSAPGAARTEGSHRLMESWWAPTITVLFVLPGMVAMMELWVQVCGNASTTTPCLSAPASLMMPLILLKSHSEDCRP
jgi:hypothetical protein